MNTQIDISQEEAIRILNLLIEEKKSSVFLIGKYLSIIKDHCFYHGDDFFEWLSDMHEMEYRTACYIIAFYRATEGAGITFKQLENTGLGWTKLTILTDVLTPTNLDYWFEIARNLSTVKLKEEVKKAKLAKAA
jgi:hypothetical protein